MSPLPFALVTPATRGLSLALTRQLLRTTNLPVIATYRSGTPDDLKQRVLADLDDVDSARLSALKLDLTDEASIKSAADELGARIKSGDLAHLQTAFLTGGVLHPEKHPADIDLALVEHTFRINVIAHLLLIKHFSAFLPSKRQSHDGLAKWVHVSARVGSVGDNNSGGWYSYRSSKAALNQVVRSFDWQLRMRGLSAMCVGVHPGTVKTDLSKDFWDSIPRDKLFEPSQSAEKLVGVVAELKEGQRGKIWDYKGDEVPP